MFYYCYFAAWSKQTDLVTLDEFIHAETDAEARTEFEAKIVKRFGASWREGQYDVKIRNLTRIVTAMVASEKERDIQASG